jgi:hypothetical protein
MPFMKRRFLTMLCAAPIMFAGCTCERNESETESPTDAAVTENVESTDTEVSNETMGEPVTETG